MGKIKSDGRADIISISEPWSVWTGKNIIRVVEGESYAICTVIRNALGKAEKDDVALANAQLISAAPDLLGMCQETWGFLMQMMGHHPHLVPIGLVDRLAIAIQKARGENED